MPMQVFAVKRLGLTAAGLVAAPLCYAYLKKELVAARLV